MNQASPHIRKRLILSIIIILIAGPFSLSQDLFSSLADSVKQSIRTISNNNIASMATNVIVRSNRLSESIINDTEIAALKQKNDSILSLIDSLFQNDQTDNLEEENLRNLNNRLVFWNAVSTKINDQKASISAINESIDENFDKIINQIYVWQKTKISLSIDSSGSTLQNTVDQVLVELESMRQTMQKKSDKLIGILQETAELDIRIIEYKDEIESAIDVQKSNLFDNHQASIFALDYTNSYTWSIIEPFRSFILLEVTQLSNYAAQNISKLIFVVILFFLLLIGFKRLQPFFISIDSSRSFYLSELNSFYARKISMAVLLAIFTTVLIFPNRPELFKDVSRIIVVIPLIFLFRQITDKKYFIYIYALVILLLLQIFSYIFPPNNIVYRLALILIAVIELLVYRGLLRQMISFNFRRLLIKRISFLFLFIHFAFSIVGFIAVLAGATRLAELCLYAPLLNAFLAILIVITVIILNGFIQLAIEESKLKNLNLVKLHGSEIVKKATQFVTGTAIILWIYSILVILTIDTVVFDSVGGFLGKDLKLGQITFTSGGIIIFFFIIWLSIVISKYINIALEKDILNRFNLAKGVPHTIAILIRYTLITTGVVIAVGAAGLPLANFTILFGAFGVGIGFGLQNIFNNLVSGLILLFERPIQIGDTIEVGNLIGHVKSIGIRSSNVRTFDGAEVIVPNGQLISNEVVNWTLSDQTRRIEVIAGVSYSSDPHQVRDILLKILREHPDILQDPLPKVLFNTMGESSLDFRMLFWTQQIGEWLRIQSEVTFSVFDALKEAGIEIPFPQRDLHIRSVGDSFNVTTNTKNEEKK